jgi:hypothetical protein
MPQRRSGAPSFLNSAAYNMSMQQTQEAQGPATVLALSHVLTRIAVVCALTSQMQSTQLAIHVKAHVTDTLLPHK